MAEPTAEQAAEAQDAASAAPAPEAAVEPATSPSPAAEPPDTPEEAAAEFPNDLPLKPGQTLTALRGIAAGPAPHPAHDGAVRLRHIA